MLWRQVRIAKRRGDVGVPEQLTHGIQVLPGHDEAARVGEVALDLYIAAETANAWGTTIRVVPTGGRANRF